MTRANDTEHSLEESAATDSRYAGFDSGASYVVYDTENRDAWLLSDTAFGPVEVR